MLQKRRIPGHYSSSFCAILQVARFSSEKVYEVLSIQSHSKECVLFPWRKQNFPVSQYIHAQKLFAPGLTNANSSCDPITTISSQESHQFVDSCSTNGYAASKRKHMFITARPFKRIPTSFPACTQSQALPSICTLLGPFPSISSRGCPAEEKYWITQHLALLFLLFTVLGPGWE